MKTTVRKNLKVGRSLGKVANPPSPVDLRVRALLLLLRLRQRTDETLTVEATVQRIPLSSIQENRHLFQNREAAFSDESVQRIIGAVDAGTFRWSLLDPIILWRDPADQQLYILSGHSRVEAFRQLAKAGKREFDHIPAKIETVTKQEAVQIARNSNSLSTKETLAERAAYYRKLRAEGQTGKEVEAAAQTHEGRNATTVLALSFLNPSGEAMTMLRLTTGTEVTGSQNALTLASWLGEARRRSPELTHAHENELFTWLKGGAYGTKSGQISNKPEFLQRVQTLIARNTLFGQFDAQSPLNPLSKSYKSDVEREQEQAETEARNHLAEAQRVYKEKLADYARRESDKAKLHRALEPYFNAVRVAEIELQQTVARRDQVRQAVRDQLSLFGLRDNLVQQLTLRLRQRQL